MRKCWRCGRKMTSDEINKNSFFCDECLEWLDKSIYEYEFSQMLQENESADEAGFLEMLSEYVELKGKQYDRKVAKINAEPIKEIRRRLKEEQNLCQR